MTTFTHLSQPPEPDDELSEPQSDDQDSQELDLGAFDQDGDPIDWTARYRPGDVFSLASGYYEIRVVTQDEITVRKHLYGIPGGGRSAVTLYLKPWNFEAMLGRDIIASRQHPDAAVLPLQQQMLPPDTRTIKKPRGEGD